MTEGETEVVVDDGSWDRVDLRVNVSNDTAHRYLKHVNRFGSWCSENGFPEVVVLSRVPTVLVAVLTAFVQGLFAEQRPVSWATENLTGLQMLFPTLKGQLKPVWAMIATWRRRLPLRMKTPVPLQVVRACAVVALTKGSNAWLCFAVLLLVGFHCLLRPAEMANALRQHLLLPSDGCQAGQAIFTILHPKTANRGAAIQSVVIDDPGLVDILERLFGRFPPRTVLMPGGLKAMTTMFAACLTAMGVTTSSFNLSGVRAGGATQHFQVYANMGALQFRGRWDSVATLQHYIQMANAIKAFAVVPHAVQLRINSLAFLLPAALKEAIH